MTPEEYQIKKKYEEGGYKMLHVGCPDFLGFKYNEQTDTFSDIIFVEVKKGKDKLSYEQAVWKRVLEQIKDARYIMEYFHTIHFNPTKVNTSQLNPIQANSNQFKSSRINTERLDANQVNQ